jgi:3-dehydroquinate dehydratase-1
MLKLGGLTLGGTPRIAVPFDDRSSADTIRDARQRGLDIAEIRIDRFGRRDREHVLERVRLFAGMPTIATIRRGEEGGDWRGSEADRLALLEAVIPEVSAIDIELGSRTIVDEAVRAARALGKLSILSFHDFKETPEPGVLDEVVERAKSRGADIVKVATLASSRRDLGVLAGLTIRHAEKNVIVLGMGSEGVVTRLLFPALGSLITFASLETETAPGQLPFDLTLRLMRIIYPSFDAARTQETALPAKE